MQAYQELKNHFKKISDLEHSQAMLGWDEAAMMPIGGGEARANAMSTLSGVIHELKTSAKVGDLLAKINDRELTSDWDIANLREMQRTYDRALVLPPAFVTKRSLVCLQSEQKWRELRPQNDWAAFRPHLEEVFRLVQEEAQYYADLTKLSPYDAMLDLYEPGFRVSMIQPIFDELKAFIPNFLRGAKERFPLQRNEDGLVYPASLQKELGLRLMKAIGFDFNHGRLDTSTHPFCGGVADDVRITTRYGETDFISSLMGVLHESGHAMYEQGLPKGWRGQPVGLALGMMIHESQSLFWEMQICRSRAFFEFAGTDMRDVFSKITDTSSPAWTNDRLYRQSIAVKSGFIRVDADEIAYPLHIILRFELEQALFKGDLVIKDLPDAWNERMEKYLGLKTLGDDKNGCMQDVHWPAGAFGYFPFYSLGALTAAQLFQSLKKAHPSIEAQISKGDFSNILNWLRSNVHGNGRVHHASTLVERVTGEPLKAKYFIDHLKNRYTS